MTENMKAFIAKNAKQKIISGAHVKSDGSGVTTIEEINNAAGTLYQFSGGKEMLLTAEDIRSAPDFTPQWDL